MIFPARMKQLIAVVLDNDSDSVTRELLRQGVLEFINIKETSEDWQLRVGALTPSASKDKISEMRKRIESFLRIAEYKPVYVESLDVSGLQAVDIDKTAKTLDSLDSELQNIRDKQRSIQEEILKLEELNRQLSVFKDLGPLINSGAGYSFLSIQTGKVPASNKDAFLSAINTIPSAYLDSGKKSDEPGLLITIKRDDERVNKILSDFGWIDVKLPAEIKDTKDKALFDVESRARDFRAEQEKLNLKASGLIQEKKPVLDDLWANLRMNELYYKIQSYFGKTARTYVFSGWLPASKQKTLETGIKNVCKNRCYLEWITPEPGKGEEKKVKVPVQFKNPKFLSPFQMLVKNYSIPEYGTIDPTPFAAVAYLIMFGLMFGDAGHGAVIAVLGIIGTIIQKRKDSGTDFFKLMIWCGTSSIITGILFGSYFGIQLIPALWFDYHGIISGHPHAGSVQDIYDILGITVRFGIAVITLGLLFNWINLIKKRDWFSLFFEKGGFVGSWIFGAGVYASFYYVGHNYKQLPETSSLLLFIGIPVIILMFKPPLEFFKQKKEEKFSAFTIINFIMEWIVEILEIFSGYLSNVLSFMRVAGLGIAHVSLMIAFFQIADMVSANGTYTVWSIIILLFGNILVIALEGLSAGIQALRLNYYEFFSKFFNGTGEVYSPVSLRNRD